MTLFERVSYLAKKQKISLPELSEKLNFSRNAIYQWKTSSPKAENLQIVADYFNVSTDYLLGRTDIENGSEDSLDELAMMFRKNEAEIPAEKRAQYRKEMERFMNFVKEEMKNDD